MKNPWVDQIFQATIILKIFDSYSGIIQKVMGVIDLVASIKGTYINVDLKISLCVRVYMKVIP